MVDASTLPPTNAAPPIAVDALGRRRFLQATGLAVAAATLPGWLAEAAMAATPVGPGDGIVLLLNLEGGNDGLNTFVPIADGAYYDARRHLALGPDQVLPLSDVRGLHPQLDYTKRLWDQGRVAVIEGVGLPSSDLSHFVQTDRVMAANVHATPGSTGWLGRVLDGYPASPLAGLAVGGRLPLVLEGRSVRGNTIPLGADSILAVNHNDVALGPRLSALSARRGVSTGLGALADQSNAALCDAIDMAGDVRSYLPGDDDGDPGVVRKLRLAAHLINADIGVRVLTVNFGDFDTHAEQLTRHASLLGQLDDALCVFFTTLDPTLAQQVLVLGASEFGRRVRANANGTDHGAANSVFAIGAGVNGGFYGQPPSLTNLDPWGNLRYTVDLRHLYADIAETWLGVDPVDIVGTSSPGLGFLRSPRAGDGSTDLFPGKALSLRAMRAEVARLYLAYFGRTPDDDGLDYWAGVRRAGRTLAQVSDEFATSAEFQRRYGPLDNRGFVEVVYRNVLGRAGDVGGVGHWRSALDTGASRGSVMIGFSESDEYVAKTADDIDQMEWSGPIARLYRAYFLRAPDSSGLDYWIESGLSRAEVSAHFAASAEFRTRYGDLSDPDFVDLVYRNVLGRGPDSVGATHWLGLLAGGRARGDVMLGFSDSAEFVETVAGIVKAG